MLDRISCAIAIALTTIASGFSPAHAEDDRDIPLTFDKLQWGCTSRCIAFEKKSGALLCLSGGESLACDTCSGAWVEPNTTDAKKIAWKPLAECGQMKPQRFPANLNALNTRVAGAVEHFPLMALEPFVPPTTGVHQAVDNLELAVVGDRLTLSRDHQVIAAADWRAATQPEPGEEVRVQAYRIGERYLVALVLKVPAFVVQRTVWLVLQPEVAASDLAVIKPYLERFCAGALSDADLETLTTGARSGAITQRALIALFNAHGAFYGYVFKSEKWLNDFYYVERDQLPTSCRDRIGKYPNSDAVPAALTALRDRVKAIWSATKAK